MRTKQPDRMPPAQSTVRIQKLENDDRKAMALKTRAQQPPNDRRRRLSIVKH